jgi:protein gp37
MSANSGIEWTDRTWNPLTGCTKVSPGCDHCYAKTMHERFHGAGSFDTVELHPERLEQPLRWRKPSRVFVNSMSDLFHQDVPDEYIVQVFAMMRRAHQHTFQVLTKRHARLRSLVSSPDFHTAVIDRVRADIAPFRMNDFWPLPNVWLGVSVETQQWADIRIPALLDTPAAVRFLSCEPLLGEISMFANSKIDTGALVDWVIAGGESGPGARPMHVGWARQLRDECVEYGIPFLFKQWGSWGWPAGPGAHMVTIDGRLIQPGTRLGMAHMARPTYVRKVGKKAAGRELDGRTWDEYPAVANR